jgi:hypothetical protein
MICNAELNLQIPREQESQTLQGILQLRILLSAVEPDCYPDPQVPSVASGERGNSLHFTSILSGRSEKKALGKFVRIFTGYS